MSEVKILRSRLRRLVDPQPAITSAGRGLGVRDPRASVIAAIEETQLPRRLVFTNDRGEALSCLVRSGRLMGVEYFDAPGNSRVSDVSGRPNVQPALSHEHAIKAVGRFLAGINRLVVRSERFEFEGMQQHSESYPLSLLSALRHEDDALVQTPISEFADRCRPLVDAFVMLAGGEFQAQHGDPALTQSLKSLALAEEVNIQNASQIEAKQSSALGCAIYSGHPSGGRSVFCATQSGGLFLAACEHAKTVELIALWQECLAD